MKRQGKYTKRVTPAQHVRRHTRRRLSWWRSLRVWKRIAYIVTPILLFLTLTPLLTYAYFARDISDQERLMNRNNTGVVLYASDGKTEIYSIGRAKHRELVPLGQISVPMQHALVASEDKNFYEHGGFSLTGMVGAVYGNFLAGGASYGGSTLTQQLAKNTLLSSDKNFLRKFQELSIAIAIERTYSKDQILDMYLNSVYYGENTFGIADAARVYFGTTPDKLTLAQSSMLVGLLPAPSIYSPISGDAVKGRQSQTMVLTKMVKNHYISEADKQAALAEKLTYMPPHSAINDSQAPHFIEMVMAELDEKYGEEKVTRSGYQVTTTLDAGVQTQLTQAVAANMKTITRNQGSNASSVAIDPASGEVRGLVGSYDWNDAKFGKVNMVTTRRQPGSSFKPIYYSQALADGVITPATILHDKKTDFGGGYAPLDADRQFRGDVSVRNALNWSLNIPSVEVMQKLGVSTAVQTAQRMGITSVDPSRDYGLPLALGTAEAPLMQMTNAYAAFANGGQQYQPTIIKNIDSKYDERVFTASKASKQVISEQGAFLITDILSDGNSRGKIFGNTLTVYDAKTRAVKKAAVKTGTTDDSRDAWTIGYTPQLAVGVWVGNNDNTPMAYGGSIMAGPIWTKAMGSILAGAPTDFAMAPGIVQRNVCYGNGGLADVAKSGSTYSEYFLSTNLPTNSCSVPKPEPPPAVKPEETTDTTADDNEDKTKKPKDDETNQTPTPSPTPTPTPNPNSPGGILNNFLH